MGSQAAYDKLQHIWSRAAINKVKYGCITLLKVERQQFGSKSQ
jgi:hypothetical protein